MGDDIQLGGMMDNGDEDQVVAEEMQENLDEEEVDPAVLKEREKHIVIVATYLHLYHCRKRAKKKQKEEDKDKRIKFLEESLETTRRSLKKSNQAVREVFARSARL